MYYSKTAALDKHVDELTKIIKLIEPKALQLPGQEKCKISERELKNRIEQLVLMAYTLRRKTTNEPFVPATEQEWAHLYMDGACAKKYYSCQGRQVYVPRKVAENPCKNFLILNFEEKKYTINLNITKENIKNQIKNLVFLDYFNFFCNEFLDNLYFIEKNLDVKKLERKKKVTKGNCEKNKKAPEEELYCVVDHLKDKTTSSNFIENNFKVQEFDKNNFTTILKNEALLIFLISGNEEIIYIENIDAGKIKSNIVNIILNYANTKILENLSIKYNGILKKYKRYIAVKGNPEKGKCQENIINPEQELACVINRLKDEDSTKVEKFIEENFETI